MTDAHCHVARGGTRSFVCLPPDAEAPSESDNAFFYGVHPWECLGGDDGRFAAALSSLRRRLESDPSAGVGEIGLDRIKSKTIPDLMRSMFAAQLGLAAEFGRPVVLHGAKCWGEVVKACEPHAGDIPAFLFHGFSRSEGLLPDIFRLNGFVSIGPALLNDHAVNYRDLAKRIPDDRILVESDATAENAAEVPSAESVAEFLADLRGVPRADFSAILDANASRFLGFASKFTSQRLAEAFAEHRSRLLSLVEKRLNPILLKRMSHEDVMQEVYLAAAKRLPYFEQNPEVPVYFKLRTILLQTLVDIERKNLQAAGRDAHKEIEVRDEATESATPGAMNWGQFAADVTSPLSSVDRNERHALLRAAVASLPENDGMGNAECAAALDIEPKAASIRYVRALERLQQKLMELSCFKKNP